MRRSPALHARALVSFVLASLSLAGSARAQFVSAELVAANLDYPVNVTAPPQDARRLFIVEQPGRVLIVKDGVLLATPYLSIEPRVAFGVNREQGLYSIAFDPDYATNGFSYVVYCDVNNALVVERFQVSANPDVADATSGVTIFGPHPHPGFAHYGGSLAFGPDGMLYLSIGDGGGNFDDGPNHAPEGNAQSGQSYNGKILRFDVRAPFPHVPANNPFTSPTDGVLDLIWAFGLRNPWRTAFDRLTGDLWIADVGRGGREEIDFQPASSAGGENYGWRCMEGTLCTGQSGCLCNDAALTLPVHEYGHALECGIGGGVVYRGRLLPSLRGAYLFGDLCSARIWSLRLQSGGAPLVEELTPRLAAPAPWSVNNPISFGEDGRGEVYVVDMGGSEVFRLVPEYPPARNYCVGVPNSTGQAATLSASGHSSLVWNDLALTCTGLPGNTFGVFYTGSQRDQAPYGNGFRCIGGSIVRYPITQAVSGVATQAVDLLAPALGALPGSVRQFQMYYRNPAGGGAGFNLSDGLEITVAP